MKRFGLRGRTRYYGAGLATVAFVALTMLVVLPAFASNPGDTVPPASGLGKVLPVDVGVGGNQSCSSAGLFPGMTNVLQTTDPSPPSPGTTVQWPSGQGWNFTLTSGALPGYSVNANKGQALTVDSGGNAAIVGIAIKGGTDNLAYDYRNTTQGWVTKDTLLHAPASKFTAGSPETNITQYYGISQLVICYKTPLAAVSGNAYKGSPGNPIPGLTVTLTDTSTSGTQTTTTDSSGNYSFTAVPGDNYTVCISNPANLASGAFQNAQSLPATDAGSCQPTTGTNGYAIPSPGLTTTNGVGLNFGFQPYGTLTGTVYTDVNGPKGAGPDGVFESAADTPLQGWTVNLYDGSGNQVGQATSDKNGLYSISAPYGMYTACVTPGTAGSYAQTEPLPTAANSCASLSGLPKGQPVQLASTTTANFGVDQAVAQPSCPPETPPFGTSPPIYPTVGSLTIQLAGCKPAQTFVFDTGTLSDGSLWASVFAGDQVVTQANPQVPLIEKWVFPDPLKADGTPKYTHVNYTDVFPYNPSVAQELPQCQVDPRVTDDMTLGTVGGIDFTQYANRNHVLPNPDVNPDGVTPATSCAISTRIYVDGSGQHWLEVYAYSDIDSWGKSSG